MQPSIIWLCCAGAFASIPNGISRSGTLTVSGATPAPATNVTVNGAAAQRYGDLTFAATNFMLSNGTNTFTILATNVYGLAITNVLSVNLPSNVALASDTNGNLTGDGTRAFYYDAENRLTNVNVAGTWKTEFGYDGFGRRRIERDYTWNGSTWSQTNETHFVFDGLVPIQEHDSNNAVLVTYTRGLDFSGGINGAGGIGGLLARSDSAQLTVWHGTNSGAHTYYHKDGNGNVTALMNAQNLVVARYIYDAFGNLLGRSGPMADVNLYRFSSKEYHPNSDLIYFGFRFYDANLQRWINRDPIGEAGGMNLYGFVGNGPVNGVDALGWQLEVEPKGRTYQAEFELEKDYEALPGRVIDRDYEIALDRNVTEEEWWESYSRRLRDPKWQEYYGRNSGYPGDLEWRNPETPAAAISREGADQLVFEWLRDHPPSEPFEPIKQKCPDARSGEQSIQTWNQFKAGTSGQFASRAEAAQAWTGYKEANDIFMTTSRSMAARSEYLKSLADNPNMASWMKPWLQEGRVPPGYEVDHIEPVSIGGADTPANMRLQGTDLHRVHHYYYDPWNW